MMVSANSASCTPAEPTVAGPSARKNCRTSASSCGQRNAASTPAREASPRDQQRIRARRRSARPRPRHGPAVGKERRQRQRHHHREIEQDRRGRGGGEALQRVEDAAIERHQRDQQQIGKGDAGELDGERVRVRDRCEKPGASTSITAGVKNSATASSTIWLASSSVKMRSANRPARSAPALLADAGIGRHEGGIEGALGENGAEMIGQPQRDEKGVGHRARRPGPLPK